MQAEVSDIIDFVSEDSACALPFHARLPVELIDETSLMPLPLRPGPDRNSPAINRFHSAVEWYQRSATYSKAQRKLGEVLFGLRGLSRYVAYSPLAIFRNKIFPRLREFVEKSRWS